MTLYMFNTLILGLLMLSTFAGWIPTNTTSLGNFPNLPNTGLFTCQLKSRNFVSIRRSYTPQGITHFTWNFNGTKSTFQNLEENFLMDLLCLENGQYLIITANLIQSYDNFTFYFFHENGSIANSFRMNDTRLQIIYLKAYELSESILIVYSPQASDIDGYTGLLLLISHTGTILKRKEIPFNIPPTAGQHSSPENFAYMRAIADGNQRIILSMNCADWEKDLNLSLTAYFPKRAYYNLTILDQNLEALVGPLKTYASSFGQNMKLSLLGSGKLAVTIADKTEKVMSLSVYDSQLSKIYFDSWRANTDYFLFDYSRALDDDGLVVFAQGSVNLYWQKYYSNFTRRGSLVTLGSSYKILDVVRLENEEDFMLLYYKFETTEALFVRGQQFVEVANSASVVSICISILAFLYFLL